MSATPEYSIDTKDIFRIELCHFSSELPYFKKRSEAYLHSLLSNKPKMILMQSVIPSSYNMQSNLKNLGFLESGDLKSTVFDKDKSTVNMTWVSNEVTIIESKKIPITIMKNDKTIVLAPDCLKTRIAYRGRTLTVYNFENISGSFHSEARIQAAGIVNKDAYLSKSRNSNTANDVFIIGGNMHCESDSQTIALIEGNYTRQGYAPAEWQDIWDELNPNAIISCERSATQRLEATAMFSKDIVLPQFMKPRRTMFFFTPKDVFGKIGTPIKIVRNGLDSTSEGIPYSGNYGLSLDLYMPVNNPFINQ